MTENTQPVEKIIDLTGGRIKITLHEKDTGVGVGVGVSILSSDLKDNDSDELYSAAIDGFESFLLALAEKGVIVNDQCFQEAVETALEAIQNHYG